MSMTEEKYNEIEPHLKELKKSVIKVRKYTTNSTTLVKCSIVDIHASRIDYSEGCKGDMLEGKVSYEAYCLLKEIDCNNDTDTELEKHVFPLDAIWKAYSENGEVTYNPSNKRIVKKKLITL